MDSVSEILAQYGWNQEKIENFRKDLLAWYDQNKRDLPWRKNRNPYYIWISEIMLQQTQVVTVIPYFERFIAALPTIEALANVEEHELLLLWQGLGYYSRARNLKIAAQQIVERHQGKMPKTMRELLTLKGIGPYTAAAIGSMAFDLVEPAIDGNLLRVTARLFELDADIAKVSSRKIFSDILGELIDPIRPGDFNQAMMDLGATIMTPSNTRADNSPVKWYDASYLNETAALYPVKSKKIKKTIHQMIAYIVHDNKGHILYRQHQSGELLEGLWHYPIFEHDVVIDDASADELLEPLTCYFDELGFHEKCLILDDTKLLPKIKHVFSHRIWQLQLLAVEYQGEFDERIEGITLHTDNQNYPISTLQSKLQQVWEENDF